MSRSSLNRRQWHRLAAVSASSLAIGAMHRATAQLIEPPSLPAGAGDVDVDLRVIRARLEAARVGPLNSVRSAHYESLGDAPKAFMRVILEDCEQLAADYIAHFRERGFQVNLQPGRLVVILFRDQRSFARFLPLPSASQSGGKAVLQPGGLYNRESNVLEVFDWRNSPMAPRSSHRNIETLAHEGTHQLTFNTGLLNRRGDIPICVVEGLGCYGEARQPIGPGGMGRQNLGRLDDLAKIQRQIPWIPVKDLLADDSILRQGKALRVLLAYAQSWLLVHFLMRTPAELPKFRNYLKAVAPRTNREHRLEDARAHFGDLDALDRELRRYSVRLLNA